MMGHDILFATLTQWSFVFDCPNQGYHRSDHLYLIVQIKDTIGSLIGNHISYSLKDPPPSLPSPAIYIINLISG